MIQSRYTALAATPSDIYQHLPTLKRYAQQCNSVTELGVRTIVSTWAWLDAGVPVIRCYDINDPPADALQEVTEYAQQNNLNFTFTRADVLTVELEPVELLFIDTWHTYSQLTQELALHGNVASKYMIFHDTTLYARSGEDGSPGGLQDALDNFLLETDVWRIKETFTNNNGLTVLEHI
jgi:hypothetical protein